MRTIFLALLLFYSNSVFRCHSSGDLKYCEKDGCDQNLIEKVAESSNKNTSDGDDLSSSTHIPQEDIEDEVPTITDKQITRMERLRELFAPFVRALKKVIGGIRYSLPKEAREEFGDSGILMALLFVFSLFVHLIMGLFESSAAKKQRADLSRFYNLGEEKRVLEVENEQLKKKHSETLSTEEEIKARLKELESERVTMEREINRLEKELESQNQECDKSNEELKELKTSLQTAQDAKEALEKDNEAKNAELEELRERVKGIEVYQMEREANRGKADELERKVGNLESSLETTQSRNKQLEAQREEIQREHLILSQKLESDTVKMKELETQVQGLKSIVEQFQGTTPAEVESEGWPDIGGNIEDQDQKRRKLAELTNAAQLVGKLKKAEAETGRVKELLQKETEEKMMLESKLESIRFDLTTLREKLDRTEKERGDVLSQLSRLTSLMQTKDEEIRVTIQQLERKLEKARAETERVQAEAEMLKQQKTSWEQKFKDRDEDFLRNRTELNKAETRFYHEIREKEEKIRKLYAENTQLKSQLRMNVSLNQSAAVSPLIDVRSNSVEPEMIQRDRQDEIQSPLEPSNWAHIPPSTTPANYSGPWDELLCDSSLSSVEYTGYNKAAGAIGAERRKERIHSTGAQMSSHRKSPGLEKKKESSISQEFVSYNSSPSLQFGFHPAGSEPYYAGPSSFVPPSLNPFPQIPLLLYGGISPADINVSMDKPKDSGKESEKKERRTRP